MTDLTGGVGLLERAIGYALGSLHCVTPESLSAPTPCSEWDLRTLLHHMNDSLAALCEAIDDGSVAIDPEGLSDNSAEDPVATFRHRAGQVLGAWVGAGDGDRTVTIGGCPLTAGIVATAGSVEIAVHSWDIYQACGQPHPIPHALATELLAISPIVVADVDRPSRFAAQVPVSAAESPSDRLIAFLGRAPLTGE
jgi:uncharacterized protein (TIGR03086 family)